MARRKESGRRIEELKWRAGGEKGNWWSVKNWRGRRRRKIGGDQVEEIGQWEKRQTDM